MSSLRPCHDLALIKPRPDLHARLRGIQGWSCGTVTRDDGIKTGNPISYKVTSRHEAALGEVMGLGRGTPYGSGRERPEVSMGSIVGFDLGQVGHVLPNGLYTLMWKQMLFTVTEGSDPACSWVSLPFPLCSWVMTEPDDVAMGRLVFSGSGLVVPPMTATGGVATNDNYKTKLRLRAERVVGVGPGEFVRKVFYETGCRLGDIACFTAGATVHVHWSGGKRLAFTPWSEIVVVIDGRD